MHRLFALGALTALAILSSRRVGGAVLDGSLPSRMAPLLARAFLQHQPTGRVALIGGADDPTTLVGLAFRDPRAELLFRPVDLEALRDYLLGLEVVTPVG